MALKLQAIFQKGFRTDKKAMQTNCGFSKKVQFCPISRAQLKNLLDDSTTICLVIVQSKKKHKYLTKKHTFYFKEVV